MTKSVPTAVALPELGELQAGKKVLSSTWRDLVAAQHYIHGRQGAHILNIIHEPEWVSLAFGSGGNAFHSIGTTTTGVMGLDRGFAIFRFTRRLYNTTAAAHGYNVVLNVYAQNLDVRATLVRFNTVDGNSTDVTTYTTLETTHGADSEWAVDSVEYSEAAASRDDDTANGLAYFMVYIRAKVPAAGTGYLHQVSLRENPITAAANVPRGAS